MIRFFIEWWQLVVVLLCLAAVIFPAVVAAFAAIGRTARDHAEVKTQRLLTAAETRLEEAERKIADLMRKNSELRAVFHQSALYDERIAEYAALRLRNERDAALIDLEETNEPPT